MADEKQKVNWVHITCSTCGAKFKMSAKIMKDRISKNLNVPCVRCNSDATTWDEAEVNVEE